MCTCVPMPVLARVGVCSAEHAHMWRTCTQARTSALVFGSWQGPCQSLCPTGSGSHAALLLRRLLRKDEGKATLAPSAGRAFTPCPAAGVRAALCPSVCPAFALTASPSSSLSARPQRAVWGLGECWLPGRRSGPLWGGAGGWPRLPWATESRVASRVLISINGPDEQACLRFRGAAAQGSGEQGRQAAGICLVMS